MIVIIVIISQYLYHRFVYFVGDFCDSTACIALFLACWMGSRIVQADKEHSRISQVASQGAGSSVASSTGFVAFTSAATKLAAARLSLSGKHLDMVRVRRRLQYG